MKIQRLAGIATVLMGCLLAGCGGGGGSTSPQSTAGAVQFHIKFPSQPASGSGAHPNLIPADTQSIVITIKDGATTVAGPIVIAAPAPGATASATIPNLPLKALTALVEAKVDPSGAGPAESAAAETVTPTAGTPATAPPLTLQSQITKLTIATPSLTVFVGGSAFLSVTPMDALGQVVMINPAATTVKWTAGPGVTLSSTTGLNISVKGAAVANTTISAKYTDGSAAHGDLVSVTSNSVPVTVQAQPTGYPPNVSAYINQAGLAIGPVGVGPGKFQTLNDVALGSLYTADPGNAGFEVQKYKQDKTTGALSLDTTFSGDGAVSVLGASAVARDTTDAVYVIGNASISGPNGVIFKFTATGAPVALPAPLSTVTNATGITVDAQDNLIVAETQSLTTTTAAVQVFKSDGTLLTSFAIAPGSTTGVTVDKSENIYVLANSSLYKLKPANPANLAAGYAIDTTFGSGGHTGPMVTPARVAVDTRSGVPTSGNLYVTLPQNNQIEVFDKNGVDDGKLPVDIPLSTPTGIAIDNSPTSVPTSGYIYVGKASIPGGANVDTAVHVLKPAP